MAVFLRRPLAIWVARVEARPHFVLQPTVGATGPCGLPFSVWALPKSPLSTLAAGSSPAPSPMVGCLIFASSSHNPAEPYHMRARRV